ncbi:MAG: 3-hydroxyacyl-CoA dehydrogenase NAD-binding domain-containing protein, partial [Candidatus Aminicenantes bacterium]|nr:3-hydroxyacyl-CoA dehydrogenase NAD-binding domain-containing protein [Candidatus Aminicenantes bacterium]
MEIKKIGVVGAGTMGNGIAHVAALSGYQVIMKDVADELLQRATKTIDKNLQRGVDKGKITEEQKKEA